VMALTVPELDQELYKDSAKPMVQPTLRNKKGTELLFSSPHIKSQ
jgi:hypothetical protein